MSIIDDDNDDNSSSGSTINLNDEKPKEETVVIDDLMGYVQEIILKEAKQEDRLVKQLLYVMLSAMNLAINAPTGEGKNWVLDKVAAVFSEDDVIKLHGMTDKALFHESGELVIKGSDIDFKPFDLQLDELLLDQFGYYDWKYVNKQIDALLQERLEREEQGSESYKELINEIVEERKHLQMFVKKLINLEHKILMFLDTPKMSLISALMPLLSHDSYESEYKYVDTNAGIKTYKNLLRGWPCFIFAQAVDYSDHERWPEVQRRFIITNPTMDSKQKYAEAISLIVKKNCWPDFMYQKLVVSKQQKRRAKEIVAYFCNKISNVCKHLNPGDNNTFVPYSEAIDSILLKEQTSDMTAAKRFNAFPSLLPMISIPKRPYIIVHTNEEDEDGPIVQTIPLGTFEDLKDAMFIMQYSNGVRPYVLQWYYDIFLHCYKQHDGPAFKSKMVGRGEQTISESRRAITTTELIAATKAKKRKPYTSKHLLEAFIYPLMNQGYIDCIDSELDHRAKIYFPAKEEGLDSKYILYGGNDEKNNLFEDSKIHLTDFTLFPTKEYVISKIEDLLRYSSERGIDTTICDHEGQEIQIEALVDRYYQNPEDYFYRDPVSDANNRPSDEYFETGQNRDVSQQTDENVVKPIESEVQDSKNIFFSEKTAQRIYSDFLVNLKDTNDFDVYIGRGSRFGPPGRMEGDDGYFGNPYKAEQYGRDECLRLYREDFYKRIEADAEFKRRILSLKGKRLACFCKPEACHGDVIVDWLNQQSNGDSKVAGTAAANMKGEGVMFGSKKGPEKWQK